MKKHPWPYKEFVNPVHVVLAQGVVNGYICAAIKNVRSGNVGTKRYYCYLEKNSYNNKLMDLLSNDHPGVTIYDHRGFWKFETKASLYKVGHKPVTSVLTFRRPYEASLV